MNVKIVKLKVMIKTKYLRLLLFLFIGVLFIGGSTTLTSCCTFCKITTDTIIEVDTLFYPDSIPFFIETEYDVDVGSIQMYLDSLIAEQRDKNRIVKEKTTELNLITAKIKDIQDQNRTLQSKRNAIQKLQKSRPEIVHFFDEVDEFLEAS